MIPNATFLKMTAQNRTVVLNANSSAKTIILTEIGAVYSISTLMEGR